MAAHSHRVACNETDYLQDTSSKTPTDNEGFICDTCRDINFQNLLRNPQQIRLEDDRGGITCRYLLKNTKGCVVCEMLFQGVDDIWSAHWHNYELRAYSYLKNSSWASAEIPGAYDSVSLHFAGPDPEREEFNSHTASDVFIRLASDKSHQFAKAQPLQVTWDIAKARSWLDICEQYHHSTCHVETFRIHGMNLIDCENWIIVAANDSSRWLALSYVWGTSQQTPTSVAQTGFRRGSRLPEKVAATIRDAITVTKQLGYRFLWVDEYCIDQLDETHRTAQINVMDQIYQGADLTIVATAGEDKSYGLPGVGRLRHRSAKTIRRGDVVLFSHGPDPKKETLGSKWFSRAW
jgi:hypothetical protein